MHDAISHKYRNIREVLQQWTHTWLVFCIISTKTINAKILQKLKLLCVKRCLETTRYTTWRNFKLSRRLATADCYEWFP